MPNPTCECIKSYTLEDKLWALYCVLLDAITTPVNLPTCECVKSYTLMAKLDAIYCALLQYTSQPFSGNIDPDQINGITDLGIDILTNNAIGNSDGYLHVATDQAITVIPDANVAISASQISDATAAAQGLLTTLPAGDPAGSYVIVDDAGGSNIVTNNFSGNGLTNVDVTQGLVNAGT